MGEKEKKMNKGRWGSEDAQGVGGRRGREGGFEGGVFLSFPLQKYLSVGVGSI